MKEIEANFQKMEREWLELRAGELQREGVQFVFLNPSFFEQNLGEAALIAYLESLGCTGIRLENMIEDDYAEE
jgi:hypothetical protein